VQANDDFFNHYISFMADSAGEVPAFFNRWSLISGIGALLGRRYYFSHGNFQINPNIYCMLIGSPGTRKSSAIKLMKKFILATGYETIAASKTTKEKFILDLAGMGDESDSSSLSVLEQNLWGDGADSQEDAEIFVMADEFNNFFGNGNIEFISLLGEFWDYEGIYESRSKHSKPVRVSNPTVSILGGNTPTNLATAFPPEVIGQGFFSRILLIYGEPNGRRIAFPTTPSAQESSIIIEYLRKIRSLAGGITLTSEAQNLLERIYSEFTGFTDARFESYSNRRFNHLIKLCLVTAASRLSTKIERRDVIYANTVLVHTEHLMPKALGEFGKSRNSDISHRIITILENADGVMTLRDLWKHTSSDLEKMADLAILMQNLLAADKVQSIRTSTGTEAGFLVKRMIQVEHNTDFVDFNLLTPEERKISL
jgi:Protein of unknown function (DUF3987)